MSFSYRRGRRDFLKADADADSFTLMAILCMETTTARDEGSAGKLATTVSAITLDEFDGSGYTPGFAGRPTLAGFSVTEVDDDARISQPTTITLPAFGPGTRPCVCMIIAIKKTSDADSVPLLCIDKGGFPFSGTGGEKKFQFSPGGLLQLVSKT